jgi:hypothetical protein
VVPHFKELRFVRDEISGSPHIEANYAHWRSAGAWQRENQFSDGIADHIKNRWDLRRASTRSTSLRRAIAALASLAARV